MQALPDLHPYLQHVEPLPDMPELARAQQLLDKLRAGVSLSAELTHFVSRAAALPTVLLQRALASLDQGLTTRQAELMAPDGYGPVCCTSFESRYPIALVHSSKYVADGLLICVGLQPMQA